MNLLGTNFRLHNKRLSPDRITIKPVLATLPNPGSNDGDTNLSHMATTGACTNTFTEVPGGAPGLILNRTIKENGVDFHNFTLVRECVRAILPEM